MRAQLAGAALCALAALPAAGQDCMIGELQMFGGNFAPRGYAFADGRLLPIASYTAVYAVLGTMYGGDGRSTFALPDLRGRAPAHPGQGAGLAALRQGEAIGAASVTLTAPQAPSHTHPATTVTTLNAVSTRGDRGAPAGAAPADAGTERIYAGAAPDVAMHAGAAQSATALAAVGGAQPVPIQSPALGINYIVCLEGYFPTRN